MRSAIVAPRRSTTRARPRTSLAGWMRAQSGVKVAATASGTPYRERTVSGSEQRDPLDAEPLRFGEFRPRSCQLGA